MLTPKLELDQQPMTSSQTIFKSKVTIIAWMNLSV